MKIAIVRYSDDCGFNDAVERLTGELPRERMVQGPPGSHRTGLSHGTTWRAAYRESTMTAK